MTAPCVLRSPLKYSVGWIGERDGVQVRRAEGETLKHEGRATGVLGATSRRRGADSE